MADVALLAPYSRLFNASHVLVQQQGEPLAVAMLRALRSPTTLAATRRSLRALQQQLNQDARDKLVRLMRKVMPKR